MAAFNGWLYLGYLRAIRWRLFHRQDTRRGPATLSARHGDTQKGAFHPDPLRQSRSVVSMQEYQGRLYLGTATMTEVLRINPDDTWDLVVGPPRRVPVAGGAVEWKYPLSGLDNGFGHSPNDHVWQMADAYRDLFLGTFNASTGTRNHPVNGPKLAHNHGRPPLQDRRRLVLPALTTNGFADLGDPHGGRFDFGIRTMSATPHGVFMGTTNDHFGLAIVRGNTAVGHQHHPVAVPTGGRAAAKRRGAAILAEEATGPAVARLPCRAPPDLLPYQN